MPLQHNGRTMTSRGPRPVRDLLCYVCGERKPGVFTINGQGQQVCPDCSGPSSKKVLDAFEIPDAEPDA